MNNTFTLTDIVRYVYEETTPKEGEEIREAIFNDSDLMAEYESLMKAKSLLDDSTASPAKHVVNNVLNFSRALSVRDSKNLGKMELILN